MIIEMEVEYIMNEVFFFAIHKDYRFRSIIRLESCQSILGDEIPIALSWRKLKTANLS